MAEPDVNRNRNLIGAPPTVQRSSRRPLPGPAGNGVISEYVGALSHPICHLLAKGFLSNSERVKYLSGKLLDHCSPNALVRVNRVLQYSMYFELGSVLVDRPRIAWEGTSDEERRVQLRKEFEFWDPPGTRYEKGIVNGPFGYTAIYPNGQTLERTNINGAQWNGIVRVLKSLDEKSKGQGRGGLMGDFFDRVGTPSVDELTAEISTYGPKYVNNAQELVPILKDVIPAEHNPLKQLIELMREGYGIVLIISDEAYGRLSLAIWNLAGLANGQSFLPLDAMTRITNSNRSRGPVNPLEGTDAMRTVAIRLYTELLQDVKTLPKDTTSYSLTAQRVDAIFGDLLEVGKKN